MEIIKGRQYISKDGVIVEATRSGPDYNPNNTLRLTFTGFDIRFGVEHALSGWYIDYVTPYLKQKKLYRIY